MLLATTREAAAELQASMQSDECVKRYRGVINGQLEGEGAWTQPLTPKAEGRKNPQGKRAERVAASTAFRVVGGGFKVGRRRGTKEGLCRGARCEEQQG